MLHKCDKQDSRQRPAPGAIESETKLAKGDKMTYGKAMGFSI